MPIPVVLVVDTGVDDALAVIVAVRHPGLELCAVVCVAGNVPRTRVLANTIHVLGVLDAHVPVAAGADRRLDGLPFVPRDVHGPDGLAGLAPAELDLPTAWPPPPSVVRPGAVIVSLGPLTSVVAMPGNRVVASYALPGEPNHDMDPAAAAAVTASGRSVEHLRVRPSALAAEPAGVLNGACDAASRLTAGLLRHRARRGVGLGDAGVVLSLAEPQVDPARHVERLAALVGRWAR